MNAINPTRTISIPGVYDLPHDAYHADPCDTPSLSAGMINDILKAPALCFDKSARLNPDYEEDEKRDQFTIGTVAHVMFLEPHLFDERVLVVHFDDWKKGAAQALRAEARSAGKTAILAKHMDKVRAARAKFMANDFTAKAFQGGKFEQSLFWKHPTYRFWCRARPDFIADGARHLNDYKTTANADPARFGKHAYDMGYHRRAAWYLDGAEAVFGRRPDHYWFCNQETKSPWLTSVVELDETALDAGREENERACKLFANCLHTSDWFGYRPFADWTCDTAFRVSLPPYALMQIDERTSQ